MTLELNQSETYRMLLILDILGSSGYFGRVVQNEALEIFLVFDLENNIPHAALSWSAVCGRERADNQTVAEEELLIECCCDMVSICFSDITSK